MRFLLQKGANVNISNDHHTLLHETASRSRINSNRKAVAEILVQEAKAAIDPEDTEGDTPLSWAAESGDLEMVQYFVENGATIDHVAHSDGSTPLLWAAKHGHQGVVAYLVAQKASIETANKSGATPLMLAAEKGHIDIFRMLLDQGAEVHRKDNLDRTLLMRAAANGQAAMVKCILSLDNIANMINAQDREGRTALVWAMQNNHETIAQLLQAHGADPTLGPGEAEQAGPEVPAASPSGTIE